MQTTAKFFSFLYRIYGPVTPKLLLERQLAGAQLAQIQAAAKVEEWTAELRLQRAKIARISRELRI